MTLSPPLIGAQIGPYKVESLVGSGGMAVVYRGLDTQLQRPVAVKVLSPSLAADPEYERRFRREARLVAGLRHPNIAQVYALGDYEGAPYMVQELLPGPTLDERLHQLERAGLRLSRDEALEILAQLAAALDAAHAVGVIHRDVKPSNAIYNGAGHVVLTDFGIARSPDDDGEPPTQPGVIIGTPAYIAPEQALGAHLTPAADQYALGVVAYQILTGHVPFEAATPVAVLHKHLYERPRPPSQLRPELGANVDAVLLRALAKEPAARFARAEAFVDALRVSWPAAGATRVLGSRTIGDTDPGPLTPPPAYAPARRRLPPLLIALALLVALAAAGLAWRQARQVGVAQEPASPSAAAGGAPPTAAAGGLAAAPSATIGPDGPPIAAAGGVNPGAAGGPAGSAPATVTPSEPATASAGARGTPPTAATPAVAGAATAAPASGASTARPSGTAAPAATARPSAPREPAAPTAGAPTRAPGAPAAPAPAPTAPSRTAPPAGPGSPPSAPPPSAPAPGRTATTAPPPSSTPIPPAAPPPSRTALPPSSTPAPPAATAAPPSSTPVPPSATPVPPTATAPPSSTPVPPTATSAPPSATSVPPSATPEPTATTPVDTSGGPARELGELIAAGIADGRAGAVGPELAALHENLLRSLEGGDAKSARSALRDLAKALREGVREGGTDPEFAAAAEDLLDAVARAYGLKD